MLPAAWRRRACVVRDVERPTGWFAPDEVAVIDALRTEKRRMEWMLSRIAEKRLRQAGATGPCVSYAHSGPYGAAAVDEHPVGIDVEVFREIPQRATHLFLTDAEAEAAGQCGVENALLHFWSAKEAAWKRLGGAIPTLKRVPLRLLDQSTDGLLFDLVETRRIDDAIVALTR